MGFIDEALSILGDSPENRLHLGLLDPHIERLVPFVGAGLSADFDYRGWKELLQEIAGSSPIRARVDELLARNLYEEAAEEVFNADKQKFDDALVVKFNHLPLRERPLKREAARHLPRIANGP